LFLFLSFEAFAQNVRIYNLEFQRDTFDLGICHISDSLEAKFIIENSIGRALFLDNISPYHYFGAPDQDGSFGFRQFDQVTKVPILLLNDSKTDYIVRYNSYNNTNKLIGKHNVSIQMRLKPQGANDSIYQKNFLITSRLTNKYIGMYDTVLSFDSILVSSNFSERLAINFKNVWNETVRIKSDSIIYRSAFTNLGEFEIEKNLGAFPWNLPSKDNNLPIYVKYIPINKGRDSAEYRLIYYKNIITNPNDLNCDTSKVFLTGIGIEEKLGFSPITSNTTIQEIGKNNFDINIENQNVNENIEIKLLVSNLGNTHYNLDTIIANSELKISKYTFTKSLAENNLDTLTLNFTTNNFGELPRRLVLKSKMIYRNIKGATENKTDIVFNIKYTGLEAIQTINLDTLDFGSIVKSDSCPLSVTKELIIKNIGNTTLNIKNIEFSPKNVTFKYKINKLSILPNSEEKIMITFSPIDVNVNKVNLLITSNAVKPTDTLKVFLVGAGVLPPSRTIDINTINGMPGNDVIFDFKLNKESSKLANSFEDELQFDKSLLEFRELITSNTAFEGLDAKSIIENTSNGLKLKLKRISGTNLLDRDTLFRIRFKTYLGNSETTELIFANPKFANDSCSNLFELDIAKGRFNLDSICGLNLKTRPLLYDFKLLEIVKIGNDLKVVLNSAFSTKAKVSLFNYLGNEVTKQEFQTQQNSEQLLNLPIPESAKGIYIIEFIAGIHREQRLVYFSE
jgi:hypothetical protein